MAGGCGCGLALWGEIGEVVSSAQLEAAGALPTLGAGPGP